MCCLPCIRYFQGQRELELGVARVKVCCVSVLVPLVYLGGSCLVLSLLGLLAAAL